MEESWIFVWRFWAVRYEPIEKLGVRGRSLRKKFRYFQNQNLDFATLFRDFIWKLSWRIINTYLENLDDQVRTIWKRMGVRGRNLRENFRRFQKQKEWIIRSKLSPMFKRVVWRKCFNSDSLLFNILLLSLCIFRHWTFKKVGFGGDAPKNFFENQI